MLSIIIPTLNANAPLVRLLNQIEPYVGEGVDQILISDGGSAATFDVSSSAANLIYAKAGRGWQMSAGAQAAFDKLATDRIDDWLLFLHADSRLSEGWLTHISEHMQAHPQEAGYFSFALDDQGMWPRLVERFVALRCWAWALPYGDQGLLIRRDLYEAVGGYPQWTLFEDVAIIRKLGRRRLRPLRLKLFTDASKFKQDGYLRRCCKNLILLARFLFQGDPEKIARHYK